MSANSVQNPGSTDTTQVAPLNAAAAEIVSGKKRKVSGKGVEGNAPKRSKVADNKNEDESNKEDSEDQDKGKGKTRQTYTCRTRQKTGNSDNVEPVASSAADIAIQKRKNAANVIALEELRLKKERNLYDTQMASLKHAEDQERLAHSRYLSIAKVAVLEQQAEHLHLQNVRLVAEMKAAGQLPQNFQPLAVRYVSNELMQIPPVVLPKLDYDFQLINMASTSTGLPTLNSVSLPTQLTGTRATGMTGYLMADDGQLTLGEIPGVSSHSSGNMFAGDDYGAMAKQYAQTPMMILPQYDQWPAFDTTSLMTSGTNNTAAETGGLPSA
ncbi:uncharacterized protein LAESUDRAFT_761012 [Laetiporus sulphureus 93-53]|uniref:Uncharacterized protein n=1 Tax=Laetiporus sulphureus 93-53 TaxID=1314785 RepID=A0A165DAN6_9APHY|nr:uncharacterized protein LAESUDRAFT_761012 [Laetiporus sulphureus 93-53]KZT04444.1 hypothetical protein LAESUDRAFT_761012 [Laetiporus sulphureus 93-53]